MKQNWPNRENVMQIRSELSYYAESLSQCEMRWLLPTCHMDAGSVAVWLQLSFYTFQIQFKRCLCVLMQWWASPFSTSDQQLTCIIKTEHDAILSTPSVLQLRCLVWYTFIYTLKMCLESRYMRYLDKVETFNFGWREYKNVLWNFLFLLYHTST
jgi:hypothetical protein